MVKAVVNYHLTIEERKKTSAFPVRQSQKYELRFGQVVTFTRGPDIRTYNFREWMPAQNLNQRTSYVSPIANDTDFDFFHCLSLLKFLMCKKTTLEAVCFSRD